MMCHLVRGCIMKFPPHPSTSVGQCEEEVGKYSLEVSSAAIPNSHCAQLVAKAKIMTEP